jgi:hypothetical protein
LAEKKQMCRAINFATNRPPIYPVAPVTKTHFIFTALTITKTPKFISLITNKFWCDNPKAK